MKVSVLIRSWFAKRVFCLNKLQAHRRVSLDSLPSGPKASRVVIRAAQERWFGMAFQLLARLFKPRDARLSWIVMKIMKTKSIMRMIMIIVIISVIVIIIRTMIMYTEIQPEETYFILFCSQRFIRCCASSLRESGVDFVFQFFRPFLRLRNRKNDKNRNSSKGKRKRIYRQTDK